METNHVSLNIKANMATVRLIDEILVHNNADALEIAVIGGWQCVVKKGEFKAGDLVIYIEADAWVPNTLAPFLQKPNSKLRAYNGIEGNRLRHARFRGELSQGLVLPLTDNYPEGFDLTEMLSVQKWEKEIPAVLRGDARGNFPSEIPKTDQPRIQNINRNLEQYLHNNEDFQVTEKLHGTSCTFYLDKDDVFHVCSRNLDLKETEGNTYWLVARELDIENKMREQGMQGLAIQGEIIGPGINGNQYGLNKPVFYAFDVFNVNTNSYESTQQTELAAARLNLFHVPIIEHVTLRYFSDDAKILTKILLTHAEGQSKLNTSKREGYVFKSTSNPEHSFKVVSNEWLLSGGDEQ